jgi:hypothetical protein
MATSMQGILSDVKTNAPSTYTFAATVAANNYLTNPARFNLLPIPAALELAQNLALTQNFGW